jgi:hypothetical protein
MQAKQHWIGLDNDYIHEIWKAVTLKHLFQLLKLWEAQQDNCELQIKRNVEVVMPYNKGTKPSISYIFDNRAKN